MNLNALLLLRKQILNWFATPNVVYFVLEYIEVQLIRTKEYKAKTLKILYANVSIFLPFLSSVLLFPFKSLSILLLMSLKVT